VNDVAKQTMGLLRKVAEFFEELPEDQLADLVEGRARLTYIPWGASEPVRPAPPRKRTAAPRANTSTADMPAIRAALDAATSPEEGRALLRGLPTVADVRAVATALGIGGISRTAKNPLIEQIVDFAIGARLNSAAIRIL
jgi:hypothetical protein